MDKPARVVLHERDAAGLLRQTSVSHIGFSVPDVATTADFYGRVLGLLVQEDLPGGGVRLGWGTGHHVIELVAGEPNLTHYGFEVRDENGVEGIAKRLTAAGHVVEDLSSDYLDCSLGSPTGIVVRDPDGTPVHFHGAVERQGERRRHWPSPDQVPAHHPGHCRCLGNGVILRRHNRIQNL